MSENDDFRPNIIDFNKMLLEEIAEAKLNKEEQEILLNKLLDLYNDGWWDTEADIQIQNDIHTFIMGFTCYKIYKNLLRENNEND